MTNNDAASPRAFVDALRKDGVVRVAIPPSAEYGELPREDHESFYYVRQNLRTRLRANARRYGLKVRIKTTKTEFVVTVIPE